MSKAADFLIQPHGRAHAAVSPCSMRGARFLCGYCGQTDEAELFVPQTLPIAMVCAFVDACVRLEYEVVLVATVASGVTH